jgi:hypothetical protein
MIAMEHPPFQLKIISMLGLVACIALNLWLFRLGLLWGIVGLNISKHVVIAYLCQVLGVDRRGQRGPPSGKVPVPVRPSPSAAAIP